LIDVLFTRRPFNVGTILEFLNFNLLFSSSTSNETGKLRRNFANLVGKVLSSG
jgi:hypothetical protein